MVSRAFDMNGCSSMDLSCGCASSTCSIIVVTAVVEFDPLGNCARLVEALQTLQAGDQYERRAPGEGRIRQKSLDQRGGLPPRSQHHQQKGDARADLNVESVESLPVLERSTGFVELHHIIAALG